MILTLQRKLHTPNATLGVLSLNNEAFCFTLEPAPQVKKIFGHTRIPFGKYNISLREEGGYYTRYTKKFGYPHPILHLKDVPDFDWVYIHIGNSKKDTSGCILVGEGFKMDSIEGDPELISSTAAYTELHRVLMQEEDIWIVMKDENMLN